jgi:hypothetical protein
MAGTRFQKLKHEILSHATWHLTGERLLTWVKAHVLNATVSVLAATAFAVCVAIETYISNLPSPAWLMLAFGTFAVVFVIVCALGQAMKRFLNSWPVIVICKITTALVVIGIVYKAALYEISRLWDWGPIIYDYDFKLSSPDARYDLVVLRGDASAIDDFSYDVYVFPHPLTPKEIPRGKEVSMTGIWRNEKYLVYSGYATPMIRWTGTNSLEIDLNDLYANIFEFHPVIGDPYNSPILVSLVFGKEDKQNTMP